MPAESGTLVERTRALVRDEVLPVDDEYRGDIDAAGPVVVRRLQDAAKHAGVFAPHAPVELGGLGLGMVDRAPVFEEAGYSSCAPSGSTTAPPRCTGGRSPSAPCASSSPRTSTEGRRTKGLFS